MKRTLTAIFGMTIATTLCAAENRTIAADADETISADATYATLTVLGKLTVDANTTVSVDTLAATNAAGEAAEIVLKEGARIAASGKWMMGGDGLFRVRFEGGTAAFTSLVRDGAGTNVFEGVDAPIRLELNGTGAAFAFASKTSRVLLTGNGGFERSGNKEQVINDGQFSKSVLMDYSGDTVLKSGVYNHQGAAFPPTTDLKIEKNAVFVTFSVPFIVNSISGEGIVRDGGYNVPLTLNCESGDYEFDSFDTTVGMITKRGAGTVTLAPRNAFKSVDVKGGTLGIKSRQEAGFDVVEFYVSERRAGTSGNLVFSEFYANDNAGKDILARRTSSLSGWESALFDRNGGTDAWTTSPYTLKVSFGSLEQIASYNWRATWNSRNYDPVTWTMRGFVDYNNPRHIRVNLSSVENYAESVKAGCLGNGKGLSG